MDDGKSIKEHFGLASTGDTGYSLAHMVAPPHWSEPPQTPEFDEITFVFSGKKCITVDGEEIIVRAGESLRVQKNVRVQYANPYDEVCEYISICIPAFDFNKVHREE